MADGFEIFMKKVEEKLEENWGICSLDIPDYDYWNAYEECISPAQTAKKAVKEAMTF
jgi:hypothetical protein